MATERRLVMPSSLPSRGNWPRSRGGGGMPESNKVVFATSNKHKVAEVELILNEFSLKVMPVDIKGTEVQSEVISVVAAYASRGAAEIAGGPVIVEDAGLFVE